MQRWHSGKCSRVEDVKVDAFLLEIIEVCKKHGFSLSHEDQHGSFLVDSLNADNLDWLNSANIAISSE